MPSTAQDCCLERITTGAAVVGASGSIMGSVRMGEPEIWFYTGTAEDTRRWWVAGENLCHRWQTWLSGKTYCFTLRQKGKAVGEGQGHYCGLNSGSDTTDTEVGFRECRS